MGVSTALPFVMDWYRLLEQGEAPQQLQYADDIMMWDSAMKEVFEKQLFGLLSYLKDGFSQNKARSKDLHQRPSFWT